jgi:hypothetical protein
VSLALSGSTTTPATGSVLLRRATVAGVSFIERQLSGGREPAPLDILEIPLLTAQPTDYQTENWLLDPTSS